ncbi:MAG: GntR family transcriptional regulator [Chloroflexota bacterium]
MPIPPQTAPVTVPVARDAAYEAIRSWIVEGALQPGEHLRDAELAAALGLSRMPVREALLRLVGEGLVETAANRWTRVAPLDAGQARLLYPIVVALETLAVSALRGPLAGEDLSEMAAANERLRRALGAGDALAAATADAGFHRIPVARAGNPELARILDEVKTKLQRLEAAYFGGGGGAERAIAEHDAIVAALAAGDLPRAADAIRANWEGSLARVEAATAGPAPARP